MLFVLVTDSLNQITFQDLYHVLQVTEETGKAVDARSMGMDKTHTNGFSKNPKICKLLILLVAEGRFELPTSGL